MRQGAIRHTHLDNEKRFHDTRVVRAMEHSALALEAIKCCSVTDLDELQRNQSGYSGCARRHLKQACAVH